MALLQRLFVCLFLCLTLLALWQCAKRGTPTGGPKDEDGPVLVRAEPENFTTGFNAEKIRLYFDEYIKLEDVQNQLIVSPPLKYVPQISPLGGASKYVEIVIKDTLEENTTYTLNFGQSIVDNNEGNPNNFFTYVFSTGDYIDSLFVSGVVKDAFNRTADNFISVMLYEIDSTYTDSVIYTKVPNYLTNTLDSTTIFRLQYLKAGRYAMVAIKDEAKNNLFNPLADKIGFIEDTVELPADTTYLLNLFMEIPDYSLSPPSLASANRIIFGYRGGDEELVIEPLTVLPDSIETLQAREPGKDTLNFWFTPFEIDSIVFQVTNERLMKRDTFTVKTRSLPRDSLVLNASHRSNINFQDTFNIKANIPIRQIDTSKIQLFKQDSLSVRYEGQFDTIANRYFLQFEKEAQQAYILELLPEAFTDFFGNSNDSIAYRLNTGSYADFGNLRMVLDGAVQYPMIVQLTDEKGEAKRELYVEQPGQLEFLTLPPANYLVRIIFDSNRNGRWDTGDYLDRRQPERVVYYPQAVEVRSNWELEQTFTIPE